MLEATYYGTATVRLRLPGGTTLVTDPAFDPPGVDYGMAEQGVTRTLAAVGMPDADQVDVVLLSHRNHPDNFDQAGRAFAARVGRVVGTTDVAELGPGSTPLQPWDSHTLGTGDGQVTITAVPARHGPVRVLPYVGEVTGFVVEAAGLHGAVYISGDTVYHDALGQIGERFDIHTAIVHFGAAKLPMLGDHPLTLTAGEGARLAHELGAATVVPVHYEGWAHFTEGRADVERAFSERAGAASLVWLEPGVPTQLESQ